MMPVAPDIAGLAEALRAGRYQYAERQLRQMLNAGNKDPVVREMLAEALRKLGRSPEALAVCDELLAEFPLRASTWREAGRTCNNLGRLNRAREMLEKAAELAAGLDGGQVELKAGIQLDLGHVCQRMGDIDHARRSVELAAKIRPDWPVAHFRIGILDIDANNFAEAEQSLVQALRLNDKDAEAWAALGVARHRQGRNKAACEAYRNALALDPHNATAIGNLAISLHDAGNLDEAISGYERVLALAPADLRAASHLADALLEAGDCQRALSIADSLLQRFPGHSGAMSSRAVALWRLGRRNEYATLVNLEQFIVAIDIDVPDGFTDMQDFNGALARHVQEHESLRYEPAGHATRHGHHTADLLRYEKGPVAALERAVVKAVDIYKERLQDFSEHPVMAAAPAAWGLSLWSVVMGSAGHQLPHVHPSAWLSGVYYAQLPAIVKADDRAQAGWIEFGPPPDKLAGESEFPARRIPPAAGRMFLFPAFLYHQTVPFVSDEVRISLAFDVAPVAATGVTMGPK